MLKLIDLTVGYGEFVATDQINMDIKAGGVHALIGANGAGKTSTIMAIAGHTRVLGGRIEFDGQDITGLSPMARVKSGLSIAPEGRRLFSDLSVEENLMLGGYVRPKEEEEESRHMVLELFPRLGERLFQRAGTLSGGEQQMLAIGRALMARPRLLMIDEVSLGLMPKAVDICYQAVLTLKARGMTVLFVEQNTKRVLACADDVCVFESGRVVWTGAASKAGRDPAFFESFMGFGKEKVRG